MIEVCDPKTNEEKIGMYRFLFAVMIVLSFSSKTWSETQEESTSTPCCQPIADAATTTSELTENDEEPACFCIKEALYTYPVSGGGTETLYLGERHDDGCPPIGSCLSPVTVYTTSSNDSLLEEICANGECSSGYKAYASNAGLDRPVDADYMPAFVPALKDIAKVSEPEFIKLNAPDRGWISAVVYLVRIPEDEKMRPGRPARILAIGFEVEDEDVAVANLEYSFKVPARYVERSQNANMFYANAGGIVYAVLAVHQEQ
jgi:hypothetical protein